MAGTERQETNGQSKSWTLRIFLLLINFYLLYLLFQTSLLFNIVLVLLGLFSVISIGRLVRGNQETSYRFTSFKDMPKLIYKYFKINKKYLLATILGLTLAILIMSQMVIYSSTVRSQGYNKIFASGTTPVIEIRADQTANMDSQIDNIVDEFQEVVGDKGLEYRNALYTKNFNFFLDFNDTDMDLYMRNHVISKYDFSVLSQFPTFPEDLSFSNDFRLFILDGLNLPQESYPLQNSSLWGIKNEGRAMTNHSIENLWLYSQQDINYANSNGLQQYIDQITRSVIHAQGVEEKDFTSLLPTNSGNTIKLFVKIDSLIEYDLDEIGRKLNLIEQDIESYVFETSWIDDAYSPLRNSLSQHGSEINSQLSGLFITSIPMLSIALLLVYFSLNLIEKRKSSLVGIMKVRGISTNQLNIMLLVEALIASVIASFIGMLISIPWVSFSLSNVNVITDSSSLFIPDSWYWRVPVIGAILSFDLNISGILNITSTTVEEGEEAEETKEPIWQRLNLDLIFTLLGVVFWIVIKNVPMDRILQTVLTRTLGLITLLILFVTIPLVLGRYFSSVLGFISDVLWVKTGNLVALATRNLRKNRQTASRLAALLMLGMMLSFIAISLPHTYESRMVESAYYDVGADMDISNIPTENDMDRNILASSNISSYIEYQQYMYNLRSSDFSFNINLLAIDATNITKGMYWQDYYSEYPLDELATALKDGKILMHSEAMSIYGKSVGDNLVMELPDENYQGAPPGFTINDKIGATFDYFPNFLHGFHKSGDRISSTYIVMSLDNFLDHISDPPTTSNYLVEFEEGLNVTDQAEILEKAINDDKTKFYNVGEVLELQQTDDLLNLIFALLDTLLIITLTASVIAMGYFSFITLSERKQEIGVFRAVGMISKQIFVLLIIEAVILVSISILIGILTGLFMSSNVVFLFSKLLGVSSIPPLRIRYPLTKTILFIGAVLAASIIASAIPAKGTASKQTGSILRAE